MMFVRLIPAIEWLRVGLKTLFRLGLTVGASTGGSTVTVSLRSGMALLGDF